MLANVKEQEIDESWFLPDHVEYLAPQNDLDVVVFKPADDIDIVKQMSPFLSRLKLMPDQENFQIG